MSPTDSLKDEIAYIRTLAEEGHKPSGTGGLNLVVAGLGWAAASAAEAGVFAGVLPRWMDGWLWFVPMAVYVPVLVWTVRSKQKTAQPPSPADQALHNAWMSVGFAMGAIISSFIVANLVTGSGILWLMMPSVMIAFYGSAWMIYATASKQGWVKFFAFACFAFAPIAVAFTRNGVQSLLSYAVALLLLVALPGAIMMAKARRA